MSFPPHPGAEAMCSANPRIGVGSPPWTGADANVVLLLIVVADISTGTTCPYNNSKPAIYICTGQQIAPYLVLTAEHCVNGMNAVNVQGCENSELIDLYGESDFGGA